VFGWLSAACSIDRLASGFASLMPSATRCRYTVSCSGSEPRNNQLTTYQDLSLAKAQLSIAHVLSFLSFTEKGGSNWLYSITTQAGRQKMLLIIPQMGS
jgi:hypothetical protein